MNIQSIAVAEAKRKITEAEAQIVKWRAVLLAFNGGPSPVKRGPKPGKKKVSTQAAHDALAVKRGTATPEQMKRYAERQGKGKGPTAVSKKTDPPAASLGADSE